MNLTPMSIDEAVVSLVAFLSSHVQEGTSLEVTRDQATQLSNLAANVAAYGDGSRLVDTEIPRQRYEAVGWLSTVVGGWMDESSLEDALLEAWAHEELGV